jgi:MFS family permease
VDLVGANGDFASLNLFAYCGNSPVARIDSNGNYWNVIIGAVVGGVVSAINTAISGGSRGEILLSAALGVASGAFAATGLGGVGGQMIAGAIASGIDSGVQNYNEYKANKCSLTQAIVGTFVDTAMGATFGAMGAEGTKAFKASTQIAKNTKYALKTLSREVLHPNTRAAAKKLIEIGKEYFWDEVKASLVDNVFTTIVGNLMSDVSKASVSNY